MQLILPRPPRPTQRNSQIDEALSTATHVFIRHDAVSKPLQPLYNGPYPVVRRTNKYFTVDINGHKDTVSIDRLKPAYLDVVNGTYSTSNVRDESVPCRITRTGRQVYWPKYLS